VRWLAALLILLLATGCSDDNGGPATGETTGDQPVPEMTEAPEEARGLPVEELASGFDGLDQRQVVVAPSAAALSEATGVEVPDAGEGAYLAVFWGEQPTGGYTVEIMSAQQKGDRRMTVEVAPEPPPPDAMVAQALTYPYAAALVRAVDPAGTDFVFVTPEGGELGWPVRRV
jgi:hypothetical protein